MFLDSGLLQSLARWPWIIRGHSLDLSFLLCKIKGPCQKAPHRDDGIRLTTLQTFTEHLLCMDTGLRAANKKVTHMWSYLLPFPQAEGGAGTNSVDTMCALCQKSIQSSILWNILLMSIAWLLNQWSGRKLHDRGWASGPKLWSDECAWGNSFSSQRCCCFYLHTTESPARRPWGTGGRSSVNKPVINHDHNDLDQPAELFDVCSTPRIKMKI